MVALVIFNGSLFPVKNVLAILGLTYASRDPRRNMSTLNSSSQGYYGKEILARALLCDFSWWNEEGIGFGRSMMAIFWVFVDGKEWNSL